MMQNRRCILEVNEGNAKPLQNMLYVLADH